MDTETETTTAVDAFADTPLTETELLVLGWLSVRGNHGTTHYKDELPRRGEFQHVVESLQRFGYVGPAVVNGRQVVRNAAAVQAITPTGIARAARNETGARDGCPGCIRTNCVCRYSGSCLVAQDPIAPEGLTHHTGCHGTHD